MSKIQGMLVNIYILVKQFEAIRDRINRKWSITWEMTDAVNAIFFFWTLSSSWLSQGSRFKGFSFQGAMSRKAYLENSARKSKSRRRHIDHQENKMKTVIYLSEQQSISLTKRQIRCNYCQLQPLGIWRRCIRVSFSALFYLVSSSWLILACTWVWKW